MATETEEQEVDDNKVEDQKTEDQVDDKNEDQEDKDPPSEEERVQALIDAALKPIKSKLDKAYAARDAAEERAQKLEKEKRDAELKKLEAEGKHKEAFELQLEEEREARRQAEARATRLSRDNQLSEALRGLPFRNEKASNAAFNELVGEMVQDDNGNWKHKSGKSLRDVVKAFKEDEDNSFMFKVKANTGTGDTTRQPVNTANKDKSIFEMSQAEVLQLAREGKLPRRKR
jgi:hypothetical protein